ncbi:UvrB/UvrC motif-containing protein [Patescibacteria group bacterium]|nr:UvrB/UvrC motif-containing protein [Patescibacteria group bacterium]
MYWANLLHIYQPPNQIPDILERIVNESYRALIHGLKTNPKAKLTLNLNACLTELLARKGYLDVIKTLKFLAKRGQLEFTETAKYHPFLPKLPEKEIVRQIKLNYSTNKKYFGATYQPQGFFSPEMAYSKKLAKIVNGLGYKWLIIDEIAYNGKKASIDFSQIYKLKNSKNFYVFFKNERYSNLIAGAITRSVPSFIKELGKDYSKDKYIITAMDGETFGHHRPGLDEFLFNLYASKKFTSIFVSEIPNYFSNQEIVDPLPSTWSCNTEDLKNNLPYKLWYQPDNPIHQLQWQFLYWSLKTVESLKPKNSHHYKKARKLLDAALNSCHFWWASKYWWSLEIIEQGAYDFYQVSVATNSAKLIKKAKDYYQKILSLAFQWQRDGTIRKFHKDKEFWQKTPFKNRTPKEWFNQIILEFEDEMKKAASAQEYEKAIKWRDAVIKLKSGVDVYDVLHIVNELNTVRKIPSLKPFLQHKKFSKFTLKYFQPHPYLKNKK